VLTIGYQPPTIGLSTLDSRVLSIDSRLLTIDYLAFLAD
jgi:hypothetical protein